MPALVAGIHVFLCHPSGPVTAGRASLAVRRPLPAVPRLNLSFQCHARVIVCNCHSSHPPPFRRFCRPPKTGVRAMTDQNDDKRQMRMMRIATAVVVLVLLGGMRIDMLDHPVTNPA